MGAKVVASSCWCLPFSPQPSLPLQFPRLHNNTHRQQLTHTKRIAVHWPLYITKHTLAIIVHFSANHENNCINDSNGEIKIVSSRTKKIVVLGGNGFVGSAMCKAALHHGFDVVSLNRSGRPRCTDSWVDQAIWVAGDVFYTDWDARFDGAIAAISTIGGFGTSEEMEKLNGEANVLAINAALNAGVGKFIFISVHDYNVPDLLKVGGFFNGKRRAEAELLDKFADTGTVLRPGYIYGRKTWNGLEVPLDLVGGTWEMLHIATEMFTRPFRLLPASDLILAPPISVNDVAEAAMKAVIDNDVFGVYTIEQIKELASSIKEG